MTSIRSIANALPAGELTNADLMREHPTWEMDQVAVRTGIRSRRVTAPGETALDLSLVAVATLVEESGLDLAEIDALLYCTQTADYPMPGNAHLMHARLGMAESVLAFDYNLACSGYVYGVAIADALARSGLANEVLLVTSTTYTKLINDGDRATRSLFGDGASVTHLSASDGEGGRIVAAELRTNGAEHQLAYIPGGGSRRPVGDDTRREVVDRSGNVRSALDMQLDGPGTWRFVNGVLPGHVRDFLASRSLGLDDIDLFVFHQGSEMVLDSLARSLRIPPEKLYTRFEDVGNLSATSIPYALRGALDEGAVQAGNRVLLCAMGAGLSYGSVLVEF